MTDATSKLIADLDTRIVSAKAELAEARQAASLAAELEAELSRLEAARKALAAPQSPDGRKRIGEARRKRKAAPTALIGGVSAPAAPGAVLLGYVGAEDGE